MKTRSVVCLFVCGDLPSALNVCQSRTWKKQWAQEVTSPLVQRLADGNSSRALTLARSAVSRPGAPHDAAAIYFLLLKETGDLEEANAYVGNRLRDPRFGETFLLAVIVWLALIALALAGAAVVFQLAVYASDPAEPTLRPIALLLFPVSVLAAYALNRRAVSRYRSRP